MNKLLDQTSPYLLQHATNPVNWYPWCEEAHKQAILEDKPVLLSIGYSACHWCHVMAHESFENPETAQLMNELFINIKVDREERPDLDKIYQTSHSLLTNRPGGWPLTVFLTPSKLLPIFAGTYFPDQPRHGTPSFKQLLIHVNDVYRSRKEDITYQEQVLQKAFRDIELNSISTSNVKLSNLPLDVASNQIQTHFDEKYGGYSEAPKFPHPSIIKRAMQHWAATVLMNSADDNIMHTAVYTLNQMANGGVFDQLGGGFYRYSTDQFWMIPHFEKMLYDNGPLLDLYIDMWRITKDSLYADTAIGIAEWVLREMQSPDGGFYSAQDADTDGEEGRYYTWDKAQIEHEIGSEVYDLFKARYGLDHKPNFESRYHLHVFNSYETLAEIFIQAPAIIKSQVQHACRALFNVRQKRKKPATDDKILTAWNGLMISAMAKTGRTLNNTGYVLSAQRAAAFIKQNLWINKRLLASHRAGKSRLNAYLDDHAYLLNGLLELLQTQWSNELYLWAIEIADLVIDQFEDKTNGGFYFTSHDHEKLIQRSKTYTDEAIPSGNGIACYGLLLLGYLSANNRYLESAERCLQSSWQSINQSPIAHCTMLDALACYLNPPRLIIVRGEDKALQSWKNAVADYYLHSTYLFFIPNSVQPPSLLGEKAATSEPCAYLCEGTVCHPPIFSLEKFCAEIDKNRPVFQ